MDIVGVANGMHIRETMSRMCETAKSRRVIGAGGRYSSPREANQTWRSPKNSPYPIQKREPKWTIQPRAKTATIAATPVGEVMCHTTAGSGRQPKQVAKSSTPKKRQYVARS